jgi:hypothetical protein
MPRGDTLPLVAMRSNPGLKLSKPLGIIPWSAPEGGFAAQPQVVKVPRDEPPCFSTPDAALAAGEGSLKGTLGCEFSEPVLARSCSCSGYCGPSRVPIFCTSSPSYVSPTVSHSLAVRQHGLSSALSQPSWAPFSLSEEVRLNTVSRQPDIGACGSLRLLTHADYWEVDLLDGRYHRRQLGAVRCWIVLDGVQLIEMSSPPRGSKPGTSGGQYLEASGAGR